MQPIQPAHHAVNHAVNPRKRLIAIFGVLAAFSLMLACAIAMGSASSRAAQDSVGPRTGVRIGAYDSRAVAVAYVRSDASAENLKELLRQRAEAEKAGDKRRVKELNEQGESMQVRKHLQGFSTAPVDDILDTVRDRLPAIAQRNGVAVITRAADWHDASVEIVDVTDDLVRLFNPDEQTLKIVKELRKQEPIAIEIVAKMPANQ